MSELYTDKDLAAASDAFWDCEDCRIGEVVKDMLEAVAPAIAARALREFADNHVGVQTPARMAEDLHERADEIANGRI